MAWRLSLIAGKRRARANNHWHFMTTFQAADAPNPHDVAEAIAKLVAQPKGSRPARTVVGAPFGSDTVNAQTAPVQAHVVEALGLGHLAKVA